MLAGAGIGPGHQPGPDEAVDDEAVDDIAEAVGTVRTARTYGLEQPAKTPKGPPGVPDHRFAADLQVCGEYCYVFQCNGCAPGTHLYRCTSRTRRDYFVCASGTCSDHCRYGVPD